MTALLLSNHLTTTGLNNIHPMIMGDSASLFINSFGTLSGSLHQTYEYGNFKLRGGLVFGYKPVMTYRGVKYKVALATQEGVMPMVSPSYEKGNFMVTLMGDAIAAGVKVDW